MTPYGIELSESCVGCEKRDARHFCALDEASLRGLDRLPRPPSRLAEVKPFAFALAVAPVL